MSFLPSILLLKILSFLWLLNVKPVNEPGPSYSTYIPTKQLPDKIEASTFPGGIPSPHLEEEELLSNWQFSVGDSREGLFSPIDPKPKEQELVDLPHSIPEPNSVLWYSTNIRVPEPSIIRIGADDGAQLFINGVQQKRIAGEIFELPEGEEIQLSIKVFNNAMSGGLKKVSTSSKEAYNEFLDERQRYERYYFLQQKLKHFRDTDRAMSKAVDRALETQEDTLLLKAENYFEAYPYILAGPYLQKPANDSLHILLETDQSCDCVLLTGKTEADLKLKAQDESQLLHEFKLSLNPEDPCLYYRIRCNKTWTKVYKAKTKEAQGDFTFNVWADSQGGWKTFSKLIRNVGESKDAFGIGVGDLVNNGANPQAWQLFLTSLSIAGAEMPFYLLPGNHDYDGVYDDLKPLLFDKYIRNGKNNNYFSWTYANCAFIAIDPNENFPVGIPEASDQHTWFLAQLTTEAWVNADWRFVLVHQPPFSQGWEGYHGEESIRQLILNTAESGKIDFVISGHTHDYERLSKHVGSQKVDFLIVGGAGGSLEPSGSSDFPKMDTLIKAHHIGRFRISGKKLRFSVLGQDNEVLDAFELIK